MLSIAIHLSSTSLSTPNTPESEEILNTNNDDHHLTNGVGPCLTIDKDIPLASLSSARCGFGITSTNDAIYALGMIFFLIN
jgi:hypothetical protein